MKGNRKPQQREKFLTQLRRDCANVRKPRSAELEDQSMESNAVKIRILKYH